jgi:hypothetical protein
MGYRLTIRLAPSAHGRNARRMMYGFGTVVTDETDLPVIARRLCLEMRALVHRLHVIGVLGARLRVRRAKVYAIARFYFFSHDFFLNKLIAKLGVMNAGFLHS